MLENAFSAERMSGNPVYGIHGPAESGKTSVAFAIADHWGLDLLVAEDSKGDLASPRMGQLILIDPVMAFTFSDTKEVVEHYRGKNSVLIVARSEEMLKPFRPDVLVAMRHPNQRGIQRYIANVMERYQHALSDAEVEEISEALVGLSYPQVNSIIVDAALARLSSMQPIEKSAFVEAIETFTAIKGRYK
jgi:exopolysaccharide biosynthesis predicted pyruvyltransferase EpsI